MKKYTIVKTLSVYCLMGFIFPALLAGGSASARMLYDDFSGTRMDDQKWMNQWTDLTELVREVANGELVSKVGNNSKTLVARNHTEFKNPETIHTIQCEITVHETTLDTGTEPEAFARVNGVFYNSRSSGGAAGDVWAGVQIGDRGSGLEAWWEVWEVLDNNKSDWDETGSGTLAVSGLAYGSVYTVKLVYDGSNGFTFTVAGVSASFNAGPARQRNAVTSSRALTTGAYGSDGASGDGFVSATFDDVYINDEGTAYDTFDAELDHSLWASVESVRELENGRLRLNRQGFDGRSQVTARMADGDASYVEAKIRIESDSVVSPGAWGLVRIQGYYYNEIRGSGSGLEHNGSQGDVFADIRLRLDDDGALRAMAYVGRSDSADESEWSDIHIHYFSTPISFDIDYRLSIEYANNQLVFKCDDESHIYTISTAQYPAFGEHRHLRTRLFLDSGESGYIKALVDEVYVEGEDTTDGGYGVTSGLWTKAVLEVPGSPVTLVWKEVGSDTTPTGDRVVSGYFYADPKDFAYGSVYNPEIFVKVYIASSGWCNIAFNHVTVDDVTVSSAHNYNGAADMTESVNLIDRLVEHQYDGVNLQ